MAMNYKIWPKRDGDGARGGPGRGRDRFEPGHFRGTAQLEDLLGGLLVFGAGDLVLHLGQDALARV